MSRYFSSKLDQLVPYVPGEQPKERKYVKLNTNESPFQPSPKAVAYASEAANLLQLYPDPDCKALTEKVADMLGVDPQEVLLTNGSDEILNFDFMAFCDEASPAIFPDITYGFYKVFAQLNNVPYEEIPLEEDFTIDTKAYMGNKGTVFIANPNAPTGIVLTVAQIEEIMKANPDHVVVIDEAYVDFGTESCVPLIRKYDNLLVTQTFSKSRSMAGARLGFGVGCRALIQDLNTVKYSTNPYNINRMTMAAGLGMMEDEAYTKANCQRIIENRIFAADALEKMGFEMTDSRANFIFAKHPDFDGKMIYEQLKEKGILVRHFDKSRLTQYNRITVGSRAEMEALLAALKEILEEQQ